MKLIAAFVAALLLVPTAAWADNESKSGWADDGSTSRRINIQGMITAVDFQPQRDQGARGERTALACPRACGHRNRIRKSQRQ